MNLNLGKSGPAAEASKPTEPRIANPPAGNPTHVPPAATTTESTKAEPELVAYTCHPLRTFSIGTSWHFENTILKVTPEDAEKIDNYLKKADSRTKQLVRRIDVKLAEARVRAMIQPVATKSIGSEVGHEGTMVTQVGTEAIDAPKAEPSDPPQILG